jgi:predicted RNase H-like nuclease
MVAKVGVDGCRAGWFYVFQEPSKFTFGVVETLTELVENCPADATLFIDCPIGLRDTCATPRGCDSAARKLLGRPRSSSVFSIPIRAVLQCSDYPSALAQSRQLCGKGISKQAFGIMGKILELDELLADDQLTQSRFREIHPELCFWALAEGRAMTYSKKTEQGFQERLKLLKVHCPQAKRVIDQAMRQYRRAELSRDDVVDALAAFVTAAVPNDELCTAPLYPEHDSRGLAMENVYRQWIR